MGRVEAILFAQEGAKVAVVDITISYDIGRAAVNKFEGI